MTDDDRPDRACLLCPPPAPGRAWRPADPGYRTCPDCLDRLRARLADIASRYQRLNPRPGADLDHRSRGAPGFSSRGAANPHIVAMTDWRSKPCEWARDAVAYVWDPGADPGGHLEPGVHGPELPPGAYVEKLDVWYGRDGRGHAEQDRPPRSVAKALAGWAENTADQRGVTPPTIRAVPDLARWLDRHLDWLTRQDWVADLDDDLRELVAQLRPVTGDPAPTRFGKCPNIIDDHTQTVCKAPLRTPPPGTDAITCTSCRRRWSRPEWEHLGRLIQQQRMAALRAS